MSGFSVTPGPDPGFCDPLAFSQRSLILQKTRYSTPCPVLSPNLPTIHSPHPTIACAMVFGFDGQGLWQSFSQFLQSS